MSEGFCVVCGRTDRPLTEGVCPECDAGRRTLVDVDPRASVTICPSCGSRQERDHWTPSSSGRFLGAEDLLPFVVPEEGVGIRRIRWTEIDAGANSRTYEGEADVRFRGLERTVPVRLKVRWTSQMCPDCSRRAGRFYTAQIQLRGPEGRLPSGARHLRDRLRTAWEAVWPEARAEWRNALSFTEERPEGWDFFLTDTLAARGWAKLLKGRLGATVKESATLYGRKDGRDVYRVTLCVRLPAALAFPGLEPPEGEEGGVRRPLERHA